MNGAGIEGSLTEFAERLGAASASVLLVDYDGTLAPFQLDRHRAYPYPKVVPLLEGIVRCGRTRVVVVTGRPVREVQMLLRPLSGFEVWGAHGLEHLLPDGSYRQIAIDAEAASALSQAKARLVEAGMEALAEFKPGGVALHWRGLPEEEMGRMRARMLKDWSELAEGSGLKLLDFDGGLELRVAHPDKGDAVAAVLAGSDAEVPVAFLGDDFTDEDAFRALKGRGLTVLVRSEYRETNARVWLRPPEELIDFLERWLGAIEGKL